VGDRGGETLGADPGDRPEPVGPPDAMVVPRLVGPDKFIDLLEPRARSRDRIPEPGAATMPI
jgi:hypothetical protein